MEQGASVSVISIAGEECNLKSLGVLADMTGGTVARVDVTNLVESINELQLLIPVASRVKVTLLLPSSLMHYEGGKPVEELGGFNAHSRIMGNVTPESEAMFQFCPAPKDRLKEVGKDKPDWQFRMPVQIQIAYRCKETGVYRLRIISEDLPITDTPSQVLGEMNPELIGAFAAMSCSRLARDGSIRQARQLGADYRSLLEIQQSKPQDVAIYQKYCSAMGAFNATLGEGGATNDQIINEAYKLQSLSFNRFSMNNPIYDSGPGRTLQNSTYGSARAPPSGTGDEDEDGNVR